MVGGVGDYVFRSHVEGIAQLLITLCGCSSSEDMRDEARFDWRNYRPHTGLGLIIQRAKDNEINYF